ncbi:MAG: rod shape-determining protein [Chloroflexota bacterium]|nr:rod shape-determining protein [Chloroflexota bacterium]MDE2890963.1 rod shape-determining protein [Chloroflexota bacterium]
MVWSPFGWLARRFSPDVGIDLGTANTLVSVRGRGIVVNEPSVVAINRIDNSVLAIGKQAKTMVGRTPAHIVATRPLRDGVISDFDVTSRMLNHFIHEALQRSGIGIGRPRVMVGIPGGATEVEKRAIFEATRSAGAREVHLIEEPMAAAIGAGLPIFESTGSIVVDIGGGTTEVAVCSMGGMVVSTSTRVAGDEIDQAIITYARQVHNIQIGEASAEKIKIAGASAFPLEEERDVVLSGRDLSTSMPKTVAVTTVELRDAISSAVSSIMEAVLRTMEITPAELIPDIMQQGIALAGGGAYLPGLDRRMSQETKFPVYKADAPLTCVVRGCTEALTETRALASADGQVLAGRR